MLPSDTLRRGLARKLTPPDGELVVSYGGGVNTVAMLLLLRQHGIVPRAITMSDPGSERKGTIAYREGIMRPWCAANGFPDIVVVTRIEEGEHRPRAWRLETLRDECFRIESVPSVAYGFKKCSAKYKGEPQRWWTERQPWAIEAWASDRKVIRVIGYDKGEGKRVNKSQNVEWKPDVEARRFGYWHPVYEAGMDREACEAFIAAHGLPPVPKSACTYCPNNTLEEWEQLRAEDPEAFADAVEMNRRAKIDSPDVVGLMRCNPHGKRQLHVWAEGGYGCITGDSEPEADCECVT